MKRRQLAEVDRSVLGKPKIFFVSAGSFKEDLELFKDKQRIWVEISTYYKKRSLAQNSLFHVYAQEIADDTGQDLEQVKSTLKTMFARKPLLDRDGNEQFNQSTGELLEYVQDTSAMDTIEMGKLIDNTVQFAHEFFGIILSAPGESQELKFKTTK